MNGNKAILRLFILLFGLVLLSPLAACAAEAPRMSLTELKGRLNDGKTVVIDVRQPGDFEASDFKIKGAIREDWSQPSRWASKYDPEQTIVLYCS